ncbi:MAG: hypothetical protein H6937_06955 [Burkholderiales bacterium]|nr:hypothetical protein [Burkholderiales bacterium]
MMRIEVGAPALQGEARQTVDQVFGKAEFPMMARVTSRMPCVMTIPEIKGLMLDSVCSADGSNSKDVQISDIDQLKRAVSSMEQIATMNNLKHALTIEEVSDEQSNGDQGSEQSQADDANESDAGSTKAASKSSGSGSKAKKGD